MEIPEISISAEKIIEFFNFPITNSLLMASITSFFLFFLLSSAFKKKKIIPDFFQNFFEWVLETLFHYVDNFTKDRKKTLEIFPLAATLFIFIFSVNLLEILPGLGVFHFLRSPSSDLNFTLALAISSMIFVHIFSLKNLGFFSYFKKYLNFKSPILFFVGILESIAEFARAFSLAVRLFGNLLAGEVLLIITSFMFVFLFPLPFLGLEIFVGFVQALIFSSLIIIFYVITSQEPEE